MIHEYNIHIRHFANKNSLLHKLGDFNNILNENVCLLHEDFGQHDQFLNGVTQYGYVYIFVYIYIVLTSPMPCVDTD